MKNILVLFIFITSFIACSNTIKGDSKSQISNDISILRFDRDLYEYLQNPTSGKADKLISTYPLLLPAFGQLTVNKVLDKDDEEFFSTIKNYFAHPKLSRIYKDEIDRLGNLSACESELSIADGLLKEIYPKQSLPQFAIHVSGFKENVIVLDGLISLSGDKYMGSDYSGYAEFFAESERYQMKSSYMTRDYLKAWLIIDNSIVKKEAENTLLSAMIEQGKILYLLSKLLPEYAKDDLIGFNSHEMSWCENNVKHIWKETIRNNQLLSTDRQLISRYIEEAPVLKTILPEAPERIGCWIGWKIVEEYALKSGLPLQSVLSVDALTILKESKFKP